ncbi:hypothetical protein HMPREF0080_00932, partial [Anaeroglobus geminatus F0357]
MHGLAAAVAIVAGIIACLNETGISFFIARRNVEQVVEAMIAAAQHAYIAAYSGRGEPLRIAFKNDCACQVCAVTDTLRTFDNIDAAEGFRERVGYGRIHPARAAAVKTAAVYEHIEPRAAQAAQERVAADTSFTDKRKARNIFQVTAAVGSR